MHCVAGHANVIAMLMGRAGLGRLGVLPKCPTLVANILSAGLLR